MRFVTLLISSWLSCSHASVPHLNNLSCVMTILYRTQHDHRTIKMMILCAKCIHRDLNSHHTATQGKTANTPHHLTSLSRSHAIVRRLPSGRIHLPLPLPPTSPHSRVFPTLRHAWRQLRHPHQCLSPSPHLLLTFFLFGVKISIRLWHPFSRRSLCQPSHQTCALPHTISFLLEIASSTHNIARPSTISYNSQPIPPHIAHLNRNSAAQNYRSTHPAQLNLRMLLSHSAEHSAKLIHSAVWLLQSIP